MAISPKKTRVFITVDRNTARRVRNAVKELGLGREYLSRALNDALTAQQAALEKLCELKRKKSRISPTSFADLVLDWGLEMGRMQEQRKAKRVHAGNGAGSRVHR